MKEESLISRTALSVNVLTVSMLLRVFFLSGVLADCKKDPALFISAPKTISALSGSCLQISCNFAAQREKGFDISREIIGVWIKTHPDFGTNLDHVVFNSSNLNNIYPINITGNLRENDCTTLFSDLTEIHTNTYFFRIENGPFKATASCDAVDITVKDSPWSPTINKSKRDLKENESVTITCSAVTPCPHSPPELTWNLQHDSHTQTEKNKDGTFTTKIQKSITLSDAHDGNNINCSVRYPVYEGKYFKTAQTEETLNVSYAPKNTSASISPAGLVSAGTRVNLICSSRANPPVSSFTWFKKSHHGDVKVAEGDFYSLNETDGGVYYCVAANDLGNQTSSDVHLKIADVSQHKAVFIILGGSAGVLMVGLLDCVWKLRKHQTQQRTLNQTDESLQTADSNGGGEVFYEEMNIFEQSPEPSFVSVQDSRQDQDKDLEPENLSTQTADGPEPLYAQKQAPASNTEEELLYENENLLKWRPEPSSVSMQDSRQDQDKDPEPENLLTQTQSDNVYVEMKEITPSFNSLTTTTTLYSGTGNNSCRSSDGPFNIYVNT